MKKKNEVSQKETKKDNLPEDERKKFKEWEACGICITMFGLVLLVSGVKVGLAFIVSGVLIIWHISLKESKK